MKLLQIAQAVPGSNYGIWRYTVELAKAFADLGHESHVLDPIGRGAEVAPKVRFHGPERDYPFFAYNSHLQSVLNNTLAAEALVRIQAEAGPFDALLVHDWSGGLIGAVAERLFRLPLYAFLHGTEIGRRLSKLTREESYVAETERWLSLRSERIFASGEFAAREVASVYGIDRAKIDAVGGGVSPSAFDVTVDREEFRGLFAPPEEPIALFAGQLIAAKGPDLLLDIASRVAKKVRFVLAGDGDMRARLMEEVEKRGLAERVRIMGHLGSPVIGALYQIADVVVLPSRYEAGGLSAVEALLHGVPVVASSVGGLSELPREAVTFVPSENPAAFAEAIGRHLRVRETCSAPSLDRLLPPWTMAHAAERIEKVLRTVPQTA